MQLLMLDNSSSLRNRCAGKPNAYSCSTNPLPPEQVYHYMLAHDRLQESLDRFSGFFSCPLFTEDLTERELMAIDSENNKNLQEDSRREFQLWRSTAKAGHPLQVLR